MPITPWTMRGRVMRALLDMEAETSKPVLGYDLWKERIHEEVGAVEDDWSGPLYKQFKTALGDLHFEGYIAGVGKGKTRTRWVWSVTEKGETWWESEGRDRESGGDVAESLDDFVTGKWMKTDDLPRKPATWKKIAAAALRGEIQIAIRVTAQKTGGSGR